MKRSTIKNIAWGLLLIVVLLIASHLEYEQIQEDIAAEELLKEAEAERQFYEYHENK